MRLFRSIAGAQGGRVFANMGAAFGLNDELAAQVVRYFLPPITKAVGRRMEDARGLVYFLELIGSRRHDRYLADPGIFGHPQIEVEGRKILAALFPNAGHLQKIIGNRTRVLPIPPETLEMMLPYVAILALGAIELKTRQPMKDIIVRLLNGRADPVAAANPYRSLASEIRRRQAAAQVVDQDRRSGLSAVIGALFARQDEQTAA
jgi:hypothetical protein